MLNRSYYLGQLKTCPQCSQQAGQHVYLPLSAFGRRCRGRYVQSWCRTCR